ncbi:hypothetical protein BDZ97DRAFT_902787 [Flammula alnicola]|nr:hypothetical protein BDZ97DRAFT_902787 [Flammula alnicola]
MAATNPSAMLAESLSEFSKAAYKAFSEVESQSRQEVAHAMADTRDAKMERDKAFRELHACQLESQSWKQEVAASKAALSQAELTISHQAETVAVQVETIAQLRRELAQWKDQSRNWQEHFLRVEQERCAQSSRIDELVVEQLQYARPAMNPNNLFTPKGSKYTNGVNSAPSSTMTKKAAAVPSPTQPLAYKSASPPSPSESSLDAPLTQISPHVRSAHKQAKSSTRPQRERDVPPTQANEELQEVASTSVKRPRKSNTGAQNVQRSDAQLSSTTRSTTVIRRVQAVIHVKREDDSEDDSPDSQTNKASTSYAKKEESLGAAFAPTGDKRRLSTSRRTPRSKVIHDDPDDDMSDEHASGSESDEFGHANGYNPPDKARLRNRSHINYREDEDEDDEEEDELMLGAEENHDEVYGTRIDDQRSKKQMPAAPPKKKRKVTAR